MLALDIAILANGYMKSAEGPEFGKHESPHYNGIQYQPQSEMYPLPGGAYPSSEHKLFPQGWNSLQDNPLTRNPGYTAAGAGGLAALWYANYLRQQAAARAAVRADEDEKTAAGQEKAALTVGKPGVVMNALSNTVGRAATALGITPMVMAGTAPFYTPDATSHKEIADAVAAGEPEALATTKLRLGAPNLVDDMLWTENEPGRPRPWYRRIGGRILQNPRTGPLMKLLGYVTHPLRAGAAALSRSPHYDDVTDTAHNPWSVPAVTEHELGHAIDFNTLTRNDGTVSPTLLGRLGHGTARDAYGFAARLPVLKLIAEAEANRHSDVAIRKSLEKQEYLKRIEDRMKLLPSAYGTYIGALAGDIVGVPGLGSLPGAVVGRQLGRDPAVRAAWLQAAEKAWEKSRNKKDEVAARPQIAAKKNEADSRKRTIEKNKTTTKAAAENFQQIMQPIMRQAYDMPRNAAGSVGR